MTQTTEFYNFTLRLPKTEYARLEAIANRKGLTIQECAISAIDEYLTTAEKEDGYDEWLRDRLGKTIQKLDRGEMETHTLEEVSENLRLKRLERRKMQGDK